MEEKKENLAMQGVLKAMEKAEAGELFSKTGRRINPASLANLRPGAPMSERTPEEKTRIAKMGAEASNREQAKRRTIRDICETLLKMDLPDMDAITDEKAREIAHKMAESTEKPVTVYDAIACAQAAAAMQGNTKAAEYIRDSVGDKPGENVQLNADIMTDGDRALLAKLAESMGVDAT